MTFHQLRIFSAVAKYLNLTQASGDLHISQPSVSQQLHLLEKECRGKLYKKIGRGIQLTREGQLFLKDTEPILSGIQRLEEKFSVLRVKRCLTVGGSDSQATYFLPSVLAAFKEVHPDIQAILKSASSRSIERMVLHSEVEIGLITNPSHLPALNYEPYCKQRLVPVVSNKHPLARKKRLVLKDLDGAPFVSKQGDRTDQILGLFQKLRLNLNTVMNCQSSEAVKAAVKRGGGFGFLLHDIIEADLQRDEIRILEVPEIILEITKCIVYRKDRPLGSHAQEFLNFLRQQSTVH